MRARFRGKGRSRRRRSRLLDLLLLGLIVLAVLAALSLLPGPDPVSPRGPARVIDGDSLMVGGVEVRLLGIDAPELAQSCTRGGEPWPCGQEARRRLRGLVVRAEVACSGARRDRHGRLLAVCRLGELEINRWLVEQGWAVSYDHYPAAERAARAAKRGLWSGEFERPRDWRDAHRPDS